MMTVEQILELLRQHRDDYNDPGGYQEEEWYIKCAAKVDVLDDMISTIEYRIAKGE
jgi:hypothetical protein